MKVLLFVLAAVGLSVSAFAGREQVVGIWNDGLVGENTGFYFSPDGTGDCIAFLPSRISWTYDDPSRAVTVTFPDGRIWRMKFDDKGEKLISDHKRAEKQDWIFHRLDEAALEKWLKFRNENEA